MRRMAPGVARNEPGKDAMRGKLKRAGWDNRFPLETGRAAANPNAIALRRPGVPLDIREKIGYRTNNGERRKNRKRGRET